MNACPDCDNPLPDTATECRCGWALQRISTDVQTRDELLAQQLEEHTRQAFARLKEKGLDRRPGESVEEWRKRTLVYVREQFKGIGRAA